MGLMYLHELSRVDGKWYTIEVTDNKDEMRRKWDERWKAGAAGLRMMETVVQAEKIRQKS